MTPECPEEGGGGVGRVLHYTTTRLGGLLDRPPGSSVVAFLYRGRQCGFNKKHQSTLKIVFVCPKGPKGPTVGGLYLFVVGKMANPRRGSYCVDMDMLVV